MKTTSTKKKSAVKTVEIETDQMPKEISQENQKQLQNIFLNAPAAIAIFEGSEHKYVLANKAYEKLSNRKAADLIGKSMQVLFPELKGTGTLELFDKVLETGESFSATEYALMLDLKNEGVLRQYYFNFSMEPLKNNSGKIYAVIAITYDITEQVEARKKIEENEKQFKNILLQSPNIFVIVEGFPEMIITFANEPLFKSWGRTAAIIGKPMLEVLPELKDQAFPKLLQQVFETGETYYSSEEKAVIIKNGVSVDTYYNYVYNAIFDNTKKVTGVTIMATDITEQVEANKKIAASEQNVARLFMQAPAIICVLRGPQHVFELANEIYLQLIGKRDVLEKTVREVMPELIGQGYLELLDNVYATGEPYIGNETPAQIDKGNGKLEEAYFNYVYQPTHNSEGEINGILMHGIDVTEQVLARKKIEESEKALLASQNILKENEAQLQNIFNQAPAAIALVEGPELKYRLANQAYEQISNRPAKQLLGKSIKEVFPEVEEAGSFIMLYKAFNSGETFRAAEYAIMVDIKNNGIIVPRVYDFTAQPLKDDFGKTHSMLFVAYDITEQIKDRKKIEENEKQQSFLLKLSDAIRPLSNPVDIEETITKIALDYMDADWCQYATIEEDNLIIQRGASRGDLPSVAGVYPISSFTLFKVVLKIGLPFIVDNVHTTDILDEELKQLCIQLQNISFINVPVIKNGKTVGVLSLVQSKPRKWRDSEVQLTIETAERIWAAVERAKAEQSLRKSEKKYHTLFTSIDQGFTLCELIRNKEGKGIDLCILEVNPTYEKQTGVPKEMVIGKPLLQLFPSLDKWMETYAAVVDNQCPVVFENYFEDTNRWFAIKAYPIEKEKFAVLFNDITERKKAEEKIRKSEKQLRELSIVLEQKVNQRTIQLEQKNTDLQNMNKELEAFTYVSSHDLQEPLRKIQTFAGMILEKENQNLSDNGKNYFRLMQNSAKQMQQLINDLLAFSRLNATERKYENTDLNIIIEEVKNEFEEAIAEKHAVIEVKEICEVHIIAFQFRQLMHNLISNALKFSNPKRPPHIKITSRNIKYDKLNIKALSPAKEYCCITITDNGIGFEKEFSTKIFEVFQRLHGKEEYKGTGIGLAIVKKIVDNHNGIITATSELDKGATFNIYLPVNPEASGQKS